MNEVPIVCDLDNTLCSQQKNYKFAKPFKDRIETINKLYDEGHNITIWTARGSETKIDWKELTLKQLKEWGVKYHKLLFGKPHGIYFDDRMMEPCWLENYKIAKELIELKDKGLK